MIEELMARWCATPCSLLFISLGMLLALLVLRLAWKHFRQWDRRDPLALKKLALAINVLALMVGTTAIVRLHLQVRQQLQPTVPTYQDGGKPDSLKLPPDDDDPPKCPTLSDPASLRQSGLYSERLEISSLLQTLPNPRETSYQNLTVAIPYLFLANVKEHTPPPLESEGSATEELHGGCCVSSCSDSSLLESFLRIAEWECINLLVTLKSGNSPTFRDLQFHLEALTVLLHQTGKIPQSEPLPYRSGIPRGTEAVLREMLETAGRPDLLSQSDKTSSP